MGAEFGEGAEEVGETSGVSGFNILTTLFHLTPPLRFSLAYWHSHVGNKVPVDILGGSGLRR